MPLGLIRTPGGFNSMVSVNPEVPFHGERPDNLIIGVINDEKQVQSAIGELQAKGFPGDSIDLVYGEEGAETLRHRGERQGSSPLIQRLRNVLEEFAAGGMDDVRRHEEAAEQGNYVVGVALPDDNDETREGVRQILKSHGGYDIVVIRGNTVELLEH